MRAHKNKYGKLEFSANKENQNKIARPISLMVRLSVFFSGINMAIGTLFLVVFGFSVDFDDWKFSDDSPLAQGVVSQVHTTGSSVNEMPVYRFVYDYTTATGEKYKGQSFGTDVYISKGSQVNVQYVEDNPEISRIEGTTKGSFPVWVLFFILIFPVIGYILLYVGIRKNLKFINLLKYGKIGMGTFKNKEATGGKVNNHTIMRYFFDFQADDGQMYIATGDTHHYHRLEDEPQEKLVYNPAYPHENVLIDSLPPIVKKTFYNLQLSIIGENTDQ